MDADPPQHDPITQFILVQIDFFGDESAKRGTEEPLKNFKETTDAFYEVAQCLGTLKHEVALDLLKRGFSALKGEGARGLRDAWNDFWSMRKRAHQLRHDEEARALRLSAKLQTLEAAVANAKTKESPVAESMERALEAARNLARVNLTMSESYSKTSWFTLIANGRLLSLYFRYVLHRIRVFLIFHSFVFLVPIAIFGIGYSFASKFFIEHLSLLVTQAPWVVVALTLAAYALKKYVLDKKLKKLQIKLEASLYAKLNMSLLMAQTLTLRGRLAKATAGDA